MCKAASPFWLKAHRAVTVDMTATGAITAIGDAELTDDDIDPHSASSERAKLYATVDVGVVHDVYPPNSGIVGSAWKFAAAEVVKIDEDLGALRQSGIPDLRVFVVVATAAFSLLATERSFPAFVSKSSSEIVVITLWPM